jgi:hypothetical protein
MGRFGKVALLEEGTTVKKYEKVCNENGRNI